MPVQVSESTPTGAVILDGGGSTPANAGQRLVPAPRMTDTSAFHFAASLKELQLLPGGELVPDLPPIYHLEGLNGAAGSGQPGTALDAARRKGRMIVPHAFQCEAFGEKRDGYLTRSLVGRDRDGTEVWHFHDVWHRPEFLGGAFVYWEFDEMGWLDFRRRVLSWLLKEQGMSDVPEGYRSLVERRISEEIRHIASSTEDHAVSRRADLQSRIQRPRPTTRGGATKAQPDSAARS